jgi:hypothetical protein
MPSAASAADKNLAEMAQRLEAALRRPGADRAPPVAPDVPASRAAPPPPLPPQARPAASEPAASAFDDEAKPADEAPKTQFKNLEDEMASLLGRPKTPT